MINCWEENCLPPPGRRGKQLNNIKGSISATPDAPQRTEFRRRRRGQPRQPVHVTRLTGPRRTSPRMVRRAEAPVAQLTPLHTRPDTGPEWLVPTGQASILTLFCSRVATTHLPTAVIPRSQRTSYRLERISERPGERHASWRHFSAWKPPSRVAQWMPRSLNRPLSRP